MSDLGGPFFVTSAAVRDFCAVAGVDPADRAAFDAAAEALRAACREARFQREYAGGTHEAWRVSVTVRGKRVRLDLGVSVWARAEGDRPQLVRVSAAGRGGKR